jgi:monoamine oxidase
VAREHVIIVGAGAAGLLAANVLSDAGVPVRLIEARDRIGGRIWTLRGVRSPIPLDLGAEFIHGRPPATWALIEQTGAVAYAVPADRTRIRAGKLVEFDLSEMKSAMERLRDLGAEDLSFEQFLRTRCRGKRLAAARRLARQFVEGFDGADSRDVSARSIARESEGMGDVESEPQFRLLGGYGTLVDHLHDRAQRLGVRFDLGRIVSRIAWQPARVRIFTRSRARGGHEIRGTRAILTLPLGVLKRTEGSRSVKFDPDIAQIREAADRLGPGSVIKVLLVFREPFWAGMREGERIGFIHAPGNAFPVWWTTSPLRTAVLTLWAGGRAAQALAGLSHRAIIDRSIRSLAIGFRKSSRSIRRLLLAAYTHDWISDPFSLGAYSHVRVGGTGAHEALGRPLQGTLFFAGEATDDSGQASTVAGALASGDRAARAVLRSL